MVSEYAKLVGKKRTRVYYHIETTGEEHLKELLKNYHNMSDGVKNIFESLKKGVPDDE